MPEYSQDCGLVMDRDEWIAIVKDGMARGHGARSVKFHYCAETLVGFFDYCGVIWTFDLKRK